MCLAIPARVVEFEDDTRRVVKVDVDGVRRRVNADLVLADGLEIGDWVLLHVGFAISKIDEREAAETLAFLRQLGAEFEREMEDFEGSDIA